LRAGATMEPRIGLAFLLAAAALQATGDWAGSYGTGEVLLTLQKGSGDTYRGTIHSGGRALPFTAEPRGAGLVGTYLLGGESIPFRLSRKGDTLVFEAEGESIQLRRTGTPAPPPTSAAPKAKATLRVNGRLIGEDEIRAFENRFHTRLPHGAFWYDRVSGAWGLEGGPTLGFTLPGLSLGGPLAARASNGHTGVFINGRQLPMEDVRALQAMAVPVTLGRWWVDASGNFGIEGNPALLGNLFQYSRGRGGAYQRSTAGGYIGGDGQTSYFFDPKSGASVMVGN